MDSVAGRCGGGLDSDWLKHFLELLGISRLVVKEGSPVALRRVGKWIDRKSVV